MNCDYKVRYPRKQVALSAARKSRKKTGESIFPYWCERHGCFHIGHNLDKDFLANMGRLRRGQGRKAS